MFSNRGQVAQVCRVLTASIASEPLFTQTGPSPRANELRDGALGLTGGDRALLDLAFWLWEGGQGPRLAAVVELVDRPQLRLVGTLFVALADGASAIDRWLRASGGPVGQA